MMEVSDEIKEILKEWSKGLDQEDATFYEAISMSGYHFNDEDVAKIRLNCEHRLFRSGHRAMKEMFSEEELAEYAGEAALIQKWVISRENTYLTKN